MSAALLRRAAVKLRESAGNASPGDWLAAVQRGKLSVLGRVGGAIGVFSAPGAQGGHDARYAELMHPPVALAVADLLDHSARFFEKAEYDGYEYDEDEALPVIALARAILREPLDGAA